jgi:hypothetical protein
MDDAPGAGFPQAADDSRGRICAEIEMLDFDRRSARVSGALNVNGPFRRLALAILFLLTLTLNASAETVAETARAWGLIGAWSLDCSVAPDRGGGAVLSYEIASGGRVVHRRNFGTTTDESEVVTAKVSGDGMLNLRVFFPKLQQTREYGFAMQPDGTMRAMYNRNQEGEYTIGNGKFIANGNPTPPQHKCNYPFDPAPACRHGRARACRTRIACNSC